MIIKAIGILLITLGAMKAYSCLRVVVVFVPVLFEHDCLASAGFQAAVINLVLASISLAKVTGGIGLLWLKSWAKWTSITATLLHVLFLSYFGIPFWYRMLSGTFANQWNLSFWKDGVTIGVNFAIAVVLMTCMKRPKEV